MKYSFKQKPIVLNNQIKNQIKEMPSENWSVAKPTVKESTCKSDTIVFYLDK
jgi:hypothetical protein